MTHFVPLRSFRLLGLAVIICLSVLLPAWVATLHADPVASGAAESTPTNKATYDCQYLVELKKAGDFLELLPQHPREVLRRLGKKLQPFLGQFTTPTLEFAGFTPGEKVTNTPLGDPARISQWNDQQRELVSQLRTRTSALLNDLEREVGVRPSGVSLRFAADPKTWLGPLMKMMDNPEATKNLRANQLFNLRTKLLPLLETADLIIAAATISDTGLDFIIRALGSREFTASVSEAYTPDKTLSCARFLDEQHLCTFGQVHVLPSPQIILQHLKTIPQLSIVENFLKNAGLDLEKDILPAQAVDSLVSINLDPTGDGGLPDFRVIARFADPMKILAILPGLSKLCTDLGIYVASQTEMPVGVKLSYFLVPTFGLHLALTDGHVLLATSRANLVNLHQHFQNVITGKKPAFTVPEGSHRYWRIRFKNLNEQIQRFLQSPLLAGKGIPPIPNLSMLEELGDFTMTTRMKPEYLEVRLTLPIVTQSDKAK